MSEKTNAREEIKKLENEVEDLQGFVRDIFTVLLPTYQKELDDLKCDWKQVFWKWNWKNAERYNPYKPTEDSDEFKQNKALLKEESLNLYRALDDKEEGEFIQRIDKYLNKIGFTEKMTSKEIEDMSWKFLREAYDEWENESRHTDTSQ